MMQRVCVGGCSCSRTLWLFVGDGLKLWTLWLLGEPLYILSHMSGPHMLLLFNVSYNAEWSMWPIILRYLENAHTRLCHYKVGIPGMRSPLSATGPVNPIWYGDMNILPSFPQAPVQRLEVVLLGVIPSSNLTMPGAGGNQTCIGRPSCFPNTPTNHILIEFQRTCKNLVQFCYFIFQTDVPVIPVKWSVAVMCSVWKHIREMTWSRWEKVEPCAWPQEGGGAGASQSCDWTCLAGNITPENNNPFAFRWTLSFPNLCTFSPFGIFILAVFAACLAELWRTRLKGSVAFSHQSTRHFLCCPAHAAHDHWYSHTLLCFQCHSGTVVCAAVEGRKTATFRWMTLCPRHWMTKLKSYTSNTLKLHRVW